MNLKYDANGLIPAVAQDAESGEVLMVAWMNAEALRLRLQKWASPVARVRRSASAFIQATISTSPLSASCATAGISPLVSYVNSMISLYHTVCGVGLGGGAQPTNCKVTKKLV